MRVPSNAFLLGSWLHDHAPFKDECSMRHVMERAWSCAAVNDSTHRVLIERDKWVSYAWIVQREGV